MSIRRMCYALGLAACVALAGAGVAWAESTTQDSPKAAATPKAKPQTQVASNKLRVEGTITAVAQDWFEISVLRTAKQTSTLNVGARIRIVRGGQTKIWRDGGYVRDAVLKVGDKVQIAGTISQEGNPPTYTARLIKVVE